MTFDTTQLETRWPHRLAWLVVIATFPLIWVGGLVTTYEAGMAVPDWPNTYGYNLFLYPWQTWLFGPWDLFIEHGHRLLGALVGILTIALALALWFGRPSGVSRWLGWIVLAAVIGQGALGGTRVLLDERQLAKVHACTGPAFFALAVGVLVATSRTWRMASTVAHRSAGALQATALLTALLSYLQLVVGAQLRHVAPSSAPGVFRIFVLFHLAVAVVLALLSLLLAGRALLRFRGQPRLVCLATALCILVIGQIALGGGTWLVNYAWPWHDASAPHWAAAHTIVAHGQLQTLITTAHVALGSLIVAAALALTMWSWRLVTASTVADAESSQAITAPVRQSGARRSDDRDELVCVAGAVAGGLS